MYTIANVDSNGYSNSYAHGDSKCYSYTDSYFNDAFAAETYTNAETGANA